MDETESMKSADFHKVHKTKQKRKLYSKFRGTSLDSSQPLSLSQDDSTSNSQDEQDEQDEDKLDIHEKMREKMSRVRTRYENSALPMYIEGRNVTVEHIDTAVNTLTVVDTLVLTIPFGLVGIYTSSYWDWLEAMPCNIEGALMPLTNEAPFTYYHRQVITQMWIIFTSSVTGIVLSMFYYLLRPPNGAGSFEGWWHRGKYAFFLMFLCAVIPVVTVLNNAGSMLNGWVMVSSGQFCNGAPGTVESVALPIRAGYFATSLAVAIGFFVML